VSVDTATLCGTVVHMRYVASVEEQERKLRLAESAAASAVLNGCDPDEVRRRVEIGLADAAALNAPRPVPPVSSTRRAGAVEDLARAVGL
jgi:hypothetical protein